MAAGRRGEHDGQVAAAGEGAPDAGMAAIAATFTAQAAAGVLPARAAPGLPGPDMDVIGPADVWPLRLPPQQNSAGGTLDPVDWGPPAGSGRAWRIDEVIITLGAGTSLVQFYKEAVQAVQLRFQTSGSGIWEPSMLMLLPGERLLAITTGGGATFAIEGEQIATRVLPRYLL